MKYATIAALVLSTGTLMACSHGNHDDIRSELAAIRSIAEGADQKATAAQDAAQEASTAASQAAQEAQTASEKADRIFRANLRK